jgi:hypothetical protein
MPINANIFCEGSLTESELLMKINQYVYQNYCSMCKGLFHNRAICHKNFDKHTD